MTAVPASRRRRGVDDTEAPAPRWHQCPAHCTVTGTEAQAEPESHRRLSSESPRLVIYPVIIWKSDTLGKSG